MCGGKKKGREKKEKREDEMWQHLRGLLHGRKLKSSKTDGDVADLNNVEDASAHLGEVKGYFSRSLAQTMGLWDKIVSYQFI